MFADHLGPNMAVWHRDWRETAGWPRHSHAKLLFVRPFVQYTIMFFGWQRMVELYFGGDGLDTITEPTRGQKRASRRVLGRQFET